MNHSPAGGRPAAEASSARVRRWCGVPLSPATVRTSDVLVVVLIGLAVWGFVDVRRRGRVVPEHLEYHRTDVTVFTVAGAAFFDGRDPYEVQSPRGWYYLYPPLFALMMAPLSALRGEDQALAWFAVSVACGLGCFFESRRLWTLFSSAAEEGRDSLHMHGWWVGVCSGLAVALPTFDCLQRGQLGVALLYPLLLGFRLVFEGRSAGLVGLGGLVLAWPVVVKLVPALPVFCLLVQQWAAVVPAAAGRSGTRRKAASVTAGLLVGGFLFVLAIPGALLGWEENIRHLERWAAKVASNSEVGQDHGFHIDSPTNQSLTNAAYYFSATLTGTQPDPAKFGHWYFYDKAIALQHREDATTRLVVGCVKAVVLAVLGLLTLLSGRSRDRLAQGAVAGLACLAIVLISPIAWGHYFMIWLPAILLVGAWIGREGSPNLARVLVAVPVVLTWGQYLFLKSWGTAGLLGVGAAAWFGVTACLVLVLLLRRYPEPSIGQAARQDAGGHSYQGRHQTATGGGGVARPGSLPWVRD